jgi:hypothetical protein
MEHNNSFSRLWWEMKIMYVKFLVYYGSLLMSQNVRITCFYWGIFWVFWTWTSSLLLGNLVVPHSRESPDQHSSL